MKARVDGHIVDLTPRMKVDRYKTHDIELVVDRLKISAIETGIKRLQESMIAAMYQGDESLMVLDMETEESRYFSRSLMCPNSGISTLLLNPIPSPSIHQKECAIAAKGLELSMW